jgi:hypothetical protein
VVFGVVSPAKGEISNFTVTFNEKNTKIVLATASFNPKIALLDLSTRLNINEITADNPTPGEITTYRLNIDSNLPILPENGAIWIDWPEDYVGLYRETQVCSAVYQLGNSENCSWMRETNRLRTEIRVPMPLATSFAYKNPSKAFNITLKGVTNPKINGPTGAFEVRYVDLSAKRVLSSSFGALEVNFITIKGGDLAISLANTHITVTKGTFSPAIPIDLSPGSANKVKIDMFSTNTGLIFTPNSFEFQYAWNAQASFVVGATASAQLGTYKITFNKREYNQISRFLPAKGIEIEVIEAKNAINMEIVGNSTIFTQEKEEFLLKLGQPSMYPFTVKPLASNQSAFITFDPAELMIKSGDSEVKFTVVAGNEAENCVLSFNISAESGSLPYIQSIPSISLRITAKTSVSLELLSINITEIGRTSVKISFNFTSYAQVYYMYSKKGTGKPTAQQLQAGGAGNSGVKQYFGEISGKMAVNVLKFLQDDTLYVLFYTYTGLNDVLEAYFRTAESYSPAIFSLSFTNTANKPSPQVVTEALSQILAVPANCLQFKGGKQGNTGNRRLLSEIVYEFLLTTDRSQEIGSPLAQIALLDQRKATLKIFLPDLNAETSIGTTAYEVKSTTPQFIMPPRVLFVSPTSVSIGVVQDQAGTIYAVLLNRTAARPSSEQIVNGLDGGNGPVSEGRYQVEYCLNGTMSVVNFDNLDPFRRYRVWIAGKNDLPGFPKTTAEEDVVYLNLTAGKKLADKEERTILKAMSEGAGWMVLGVYLAFF